MGAGQEFVSIPRGKWPGSCRCPGSSSSRDCPRAPEGMPTAVPRTASDAGRRYVDLDGVAERRPTSEDAGEGVSAEAIVYSTALEYGAELLTCDAHFEKLPGTLLIRKGA